MSRPCYPCSMFQMVSQFSRSLRLVLLLCLLASFCGSQDDSWGRDMVKFNNIFAPYFKKYWGCSSLAMDVSQCKGPELGIRDYVLEKEMVKAWEKWMR